MRYISLRGSLGCRIRGVPWTATASASYKKGRKGGAAGGTQRENTGKRKGIKEGEMREDLFCVVILRANALSYAFFLVALTLITTAHTFLFFLIISKLFVYISVFLDFFSTST